MFERFTDRARRVMALANQEAQRFQQEFIGTEHVLLGLMKEGSGVAASVLTRLDLDVRKVRAEVQKLIPEGPKAATLAKLPMTPRVKNVIRSAIEEARRLHHDYVGTEHLLVGLLNEREGIAAQVLTNLNVPIEHVGRAIGELYGAVEASDEARAASESIPPVPGATKGWKNFWTVLLHVGRAMIMLSVPPFLGLTFLVIVLERRTSWINEPLVMAVSMMVLMFGCMVYFAAKLGGWCARGGR